MPAFHDGNGDLISTMNAQASFAVTRQIGLLLLVCGLGAGAVPASLGQSKTAEGTTMPQTRADAASGAVFDVASIRPTMTKEPGRSHIVSLPRDGHFTAINVTVNQLLQWAFRMPEGRVLGGPGWLNSAKFDIEAKADESVDAELEKLDSDAGRLQKQKMLQALLAERFALKTHVETRELPIYAMVVAKNGPKLEKSKANGTSINWRTGQITVQGSDSTVGLLAEQLTKVLDRVVVDKTGIQGRFTISLNWTPDDGAAANSSGSLADTSGPSVFTAIQEQLGLKLVSQRGPVQVLVIDHVEMPTEN
jgi:uncharacterized protein (TIGR03435 family)